MPRHRRATQPVLPAALAVGVLGTALVGGAATDGPAPAAVVSPVPDAVLPAPVAVRPREAITDVGL